MIAYCLKKKKKLRNQYFIFFFKKIIVKVYFSNFQKMNSRTFRIYYDDGHINFDSYNDNNYILHKIKKLCII